MVDTLYIAQNSTSAFELGYNHNVKNVDFEDLTNLNGVLCNYDTLTLMTVTV